MLLSNFWLFWPVCDGTEGRHEPGVQPLLDVESLVLVRDKDGQVRTADVRWSVRRRVNIKDDLYIVFVQKISTACQILHCIFIIQRQLILQHCSQCWGSVSGGSIKNWHPESGSGSVILIYGSGSGSIQFVKDSKIFQKTCSNFLKYLIIYNLFDNIFYSVATKMSRLDQVSDLARFIINRLPNPDP